MLTLEKSTIEQLTTLLNKNECDKNEEIAPSFLLEFAIDKQMDLSKKVAKLMQMTMKF